MIYSLHESGNWAQSPKNGHHLADLDPVGAGGGTRPGQPGMTRTSAV